MCRAEGSGSAVADEAYNYAKEFLNNQADYNLEYNYEKLIEQTKKLNAWRDDILAQAKTKQVTQACEAWISRVKKYEEEVRELETKYKKEKSNRTRSQFLHGSSESGEDLSQSMVEKGKNMHDLGVDVKSEIGIVVDKLPEHVIIMHGEEKTEDEVVSEPHGMVIDVKEVKTTNSSGQKKFEIEEIGKEASSQLRQPEGIQVEEMQLQASSTLKPQGVVFDGEAIKILKSSEMEPEASEQHGLFLMLGGLGLTKPPKDEDWKNAREIYLMDNELSDLPENPRCPNLSALFLPRNYKLRMIPQPFFNFMPSLQILNLSRTGIKSLPDSLIRLVSLKRLFLNDCHRLMILSPKIGDLKQLEVLDLEGANIMDLPKEIKNLTNLTCLEVSFYGFTSNGRRTMQSNAVVPCGVISALSQLEELNIDVNPDDERWDACVEDIVNEVCTLKRLETLKFYFPRVELLSHFQWNSPSLSNFRFTIGHHVKRIMSRVPPDAEFELEQWERCLKYINGVGVHRDIKNVLQHVTAFFLDRHATIKKLSDFETRNMKQLKCCVVGECNELQVIIDAADAYGEDGISEIVSESYDDERIVLGSLEHLYIYYMKSLRSIWEGSVQKNSLFLLKSLTLSTCPN
ncbi:disease resistance protein RPS2 [Quercus suber]|uniref:disease resistance protein RPS2 n=1 Tax=Quercus suber TaxID=58331 RepID=UPI0032DF1817